MAVKRTRIDARVDLPRCRCPVCGAVHWRRKGGKKAANPKRDARIYQLHNMGATRKELMAKFKLSSPRITTILQNQRAKALAQTLGR